MKYLNSLALFSCPFVCVGRDLLTPVSVSANAPLAPTAWTPLTGVACVPTRSTVEALAPVNPAKKRRRSGAVARR